MTARTFPDGFLWGTAAAAHQVEGGNWNNDWWAWEHDPRSPCVEPSGDACDHYHRYDDDFALLASFGHHTHRFSVEWSRIEPEEGQFSVAALDHYARVIDSLERHALRPFLTLHHFSSPRWFAADGGWASPKAPERFRRFVDVVAERLGPRTPYVGTINEPQIVALMGYQGTAFPPGAGDTELFWPVTRNFIAAHAAAAQAFRDHAPQAKVGLPLAVSDFQAHDDAAATLRDRVHHRMVGVYVDALRTGWVRGPRIEEEITGLQGVTDWVGLQYYSRSVLSADGVVEPAPGAETTQMGYEVYPDGFTNTLRIVAEAELPVYVTENGIGTDDDTQRIRFLDSHLTRALDAIDEGIDLRGYLYWSSMDNFEWALGYRPTFGLIACDRVTFARTPKPSCHYYGEIVRSNELDASVTARHLERQPV